MDLKPQLKVARILITMISLLSILTSLLGCTFNHQEERTITPVYNIAGEHVGDVVDENDHAYIKFLN